MKRFLWEKVLLLQRTMNDGQQEQKLWFLIAQKHEAHVAQRSITPMCEFVSAKGKKKRGQRTYEVRTNCQVNHACLLHCAPAFMGLKPFKEDIISTSSAQATELCNRKGASQEKSRCHLRPHTYDYGRRLYSFWKQDRIYCCFGAKRQQQQISLSPNNLHEWQETL